MSLAGSVQTSKAAEAVGNTLPVPVNKEKIDFKGESESGLKEYVDDCVQKILKGGKVPVLIEGAMRVTTDGLPDKVKKICKSAGSSNEVWFTAYPEAYDEICDRLLKVFKKIFLQKFQGHNLRDPTAPALGYVGFRITLHPDEKAVKQAAASRAAAVLNYINVLEESARYL